MSDVPFNQAVFNIVTAKVLDRLYESFPLPIGIDHKALMWEALEGEDLLPEGGGPEVRSLVADAVADSTMEWLLQYDYFTGTRIVGRGYIQVVLTPKGLSILNRLPSALEPRPVPIGKRLKSLSVKIGTEAAKDQLASIVKDIVNYGTSAIAAADIESIQAKVEALLSRQ